MKILFMAAALVLAAACSGPSATAAPQPVSIQLADFKIQPSTLTLSGNSFTFTVTSAGPTPHNFNIRDESGTLVATKDLRTGDSDTVTASLAPGTYTYFCAFPGHESLGMHGTLTVVAQ